MLNKNLENIGLGRRVRDQLDADMLARHQLARVTSVHKDRFTISNGAQELTAELSGNLYYSADTPLDLPTVGDWVYADFYDDEHAIIHGIVSRNTLLKRKTAGKAVDFQLIAANIDTAFILQSVDFNFNLGRLERYLVMTNEGGITPVILLSKCDLIPREELVKLRESILSIAPHVTILAFSNLNGENLHTIKDTLAPGSTYCLLGSSGVGKTTLLNNILGSDQYETQSVSRKQSKGKHTTTSRELIQLENGAMIIDTPGMRELGNMAIDTGLDETFDEILELSRHCQFGNCAHINEKGCAVLSAVAKGQLSQRRYQNFLKMKNESAFNEMSYAEKRKKDRAFGKLIKATMKNKRR